MADYLNARAGQQARAAWPLQGIDRGAAQLLGLTDPTTAPLVKLTLAAIRRDKGVAQRQAAPLRFKGPVSDVERDPARGLNLRALLESCGGDPVGLRDRALLSLAYGNGLRASELVAVDLEHIIPATDPDARLLVVPRSKGDSANKAMIATILGAVERTPLWVRHDLISKDPAIKARAEDTLSAMIANAPETASDQTA